MKRLGLLATILAVGTTAFAQMQDNQQKELTCDNGGHNDSHVRFCEVREQSLASIANLDVDSGKNGGIHVKGWSRNSILIRTRVEAWAASDAEASDLGHQVTVDIANARIRPDGPAPGDHSWWSASFEIFVPQTINLSLQTFNGGISISDVRGDLHVRAKNGGIHLNRLAGSISGATVNGAVHLELAGNTWDGSQIELQTTNGGVTVAMPADYSAHIQTGTVNGSIRSDFPITVHGSIRSTSLDFNLGSGGPLIHVTTTNGSVKLKQI